MLVPWHWNSVHVVRMLLSKDVLQVYRSNVSLKRFDKNCKVITS